MSCWRGEPTGDSAKEALWPSQVGAALHSITHSSNCCGRSCCTRSCTCNTKCSRDMTISHQSANINHETWPESETPATTARATAEARQVKPHACDASVGIIGNTDTAIHAYEHHTRRRAPGASIPPPRSSENSFFLLGSTPASKQFMQCVPGPGA